MRLTTRTGLVLAVAALVVALPTAAGALPTGTSSPAGVAANSVTFQDSTGEDPAAPDITTVVVSNSDAGIVSFRINVANRPTFAQDMLVDVLINTDNNPATGSPDVAGADYAIQVFQGEAALFRWDGENFTRRPGDPTFTSLLFSYQNGITITISAAELGNTRRLGFVAQVISGIAADPTTGALDFTNAVADSAPAPGAGLYPYDVLIARPTLVVRRVTRTPVRPTAGRTFTLRMVTARSDTNAVLQNGRVRCVARAGNARLRAQLARVQRGAVVCTWRIPPKATGKRFRGSVTVVFEGLRASRSYSARIR
ncbi:MAG: hypothetical protein ACRDQT_03780 [Gaiellaceae bacterium]